MLTLTATDARALAQEIPGVVFAAPFVDAQMTAVSSGNLNWSTLIAGITPEYFQARGWALAEGEWLNVEHLSRAAEVVLLARPSRASSSPAGILSDGSIRIGCTPYSVIGVLAKKGAGFYWW